MMHSLVNSLRFVQLLCVHVIEEQLLRRNKSSNLWPWRTSMVKDGTAPALHVHAAGLTWPDNNSSDELYSYDSCMHACGWEPECDDSHSD